LFFFKLFFEKLFFKFFFICLPLEKLINEKHFAVKEKFGLVFRKVFSFYFGRKTLLGSREKFRNIILFTDYIKFGPHFYNCYLLFPYNFLIEIFYLSNLVPILLIVTYFIWNNFLIWNFWLLILFKISVFQFIFHYTTKYRKIIHFPVIHFPKKTTFQKINGKK